MYKDTVEAKRIVQEQDSNGLWGLFHTLSEPTGKPLTTEQSLRRLEVLGYTKDDQCINKSIVYMNQCLIGNKTMPDRREKSHDWDLFTDLMLATWIRRFTPDVKAANDIAKKWANVITCAFQNGSYSQDEYVKAFENIFNTKLYGPMFLNFVNLYHVSLLTNMLEPKIENLFVKYILNNENGIYYFGYRKCLKELPDEFASKQTVKFLASIKLLLQYKHSQKQLDFVFNWLDKQKNLNGTWDLGSKSKDKIYLPLSDSWRKKEDRIKDCTYMINEIYKVREASLCLK